MQISILVFLKSSSGKIPAGSATIFVKNDKERQRAVINIEKCPDKTASIEYSLRLNFISD